MTIGNKKQHNRIKGGGKMKKPKKHTEQQPPVTTTELPVFTQPDSTTNIPIAYAQADKQN